jgi:serine/threonine protein kinase
MEERWGLFKGRSYFLCPYIDGVDARHFFACDAQPNTTWAIAAKNICTMMKALVQNKISHRDLNLSNIILVANKPYLIDLDAMKHYNFSWVARWAAKKEQRRFMENWQNDPKPHESAAKLFQTFLNE